MAPRPPGRVLRAGPGPRGMLRLCPKAAEFASRAPRGRPGEGGKARAARLVSTGAAPGPGPRQGHLAGPTRGRSTVTQSFARRSGSRCFHVLQRGRDLPPERRPVPGTEPPTRDPAPSTPSPSPQRCCCGLCPRQRSPPCGDPPAGPKSSSTQQTSTSEAASTHTAPLRSLSAAAPQTPSKRSSISEFLPTGGT